MHRHHFFIHYFTTILLMYRRAFLKNLGGTVMLASMAGLPLDLLAEGDDLTKITILHTNDVHSRIEPFPMDGGRFQGLGGAAKRAQLIKNIRQQEKNVLLLDSGDIFQGTPYFNYFGGELEFKLMSQMRYDVATIGNHDFDGGIDGLHQQLPHANFQFVSANYDFSDTILNETVKPYTIIKKSGIKIGIFGLGIELEGLVPKDLYKNTIYLSPVEKANEYAAILKKEEKCDLVICLSHLGYKYSGKKISDVVLAQSTQNIDLILGGHTHTFLDQPTTLKNTADQPVLVHQVGWAGIVLGRLDVYFEKTKNKHCTTCNNLTIK